MARRVGEGSPEPLGVTPDADGVNVAVFSAHAGAVEFCLFDDEGGRELERIDLPARTGDVFHAHIADVAAGARYGLRAHGPYAPAAGHRFNAAKLLLDPYAQAIDRRFALHSSMFGFRDGDPFAEGAFDATDSAPFMPKAIVGVPASAPSGRPARAWADTLIYELHVRGFTMRHPDIPAPLRGTFAGLAHPAAIDHLARLGVTAVEIMPAAAWIDERHLPALGLGNYWGYNPVAFMAPDPRLAPGGWEEIATAVAALHGAGIEVVLDVVLNHSGESDSFGPTVSLRGLDNASYYRLRPDDPARYIDDAGCGNCLALDHPQVLRLALDALRAWVERTGIDGLRFDLATALGRRPAGFDPAAPLLAAIDQDPLLRRLKLIAEPWDIGPGGYQLGAFPPGWGEWNDRFRDDVRRFWRGDQGQLGSLATRLAGSSDVFARPGRRPSRSVNFIVAHDGFTLADLVAHERKHNKANGESNRDGTNDNLSWNNGAEGPTADGAVAAARRRDQRALLATLLLARGTPMLAMGSELGQSQGGNNNAYAQDNGTAWLDWDAADRELFAFACGAVAARRDHPALRGDRFLTGRPFDASGLPDVEWRTADGRPMESGDWESPSADVLVMAVAASGGEEGPTDRVIVALNRGRSPADVTLPPPRPGWGWETILDSAGEDPPASPAAGNHVGVGPRAVVAVAERPVARRGRGVPSDLLASVSQAAGIAGEWWDIAGTRHLVSDGTKRALLAAMGLPAETANQARESCHRLAEDRDLRPLPHALTARAGVPFQAPLAFSRGTGGNPVWLCIEGEDGVQQRIRAGAEANAAAVALDGRAFDRRRAELPPLAAGRYWLWREDRPEVGCALLVSPEKCHIPASIEAGARLFGIAAHLYTLRRDGDQGIGDFTTLGDLAEAAARQGAAVIGLNPLHALFPWQRERASPYHPSDRRFLDPIYIDLARLDALSGVAAAHGPLTARASEIAALSGSDRVDYAGVWTLKKAILEESFAAFEELARRQPEAPPIRDFNAFVTAGGPALRRFAIFETIAAEHPGEAWQGWPAELRDADDPAVEEFAVRHEHELVFHQYLQWLCERQFAAAAERAGSAGMAIGFYRDLAVGAAPDGAEAWTNARHIARGAWIGAPPDPFAAEGQIWHLPPYDPHALARAGFAPFAELLAANMRHAGALRIDHVMGLARLFWIPDGAKGSDGAYVAYPRDDLLGQLALESVRARCLVVGEDLGTVPGNLREALDEAAVLSYRVLWFERDGLSFRRPATYPRRAVACVSTHDLPTLAGWWDGAEIAERSALGLAAATETAQARAARENEKGALLAALQDEGIATAGIDPAEPCDLSLMAAVHDFLGRTPSAIVMAQADDLAGERVGVNLPGTDAERPNWRRKIAKPVSALLEGEASDAILGRLREARGATGLR